MKPRFTSSDLKLIAMGTMAVDQTAVFLIYVNGYGDFPFWKEIGTAMRLVGRVAFPLFAFLLVQGFLHTKDRHQYLKRMAVLAVISEIPFNLVASGSPFYAKEQNTVLLLCIGLLTLKGIHAVSGEADCWGAAAGDQGQRIRVMGIAAASMAFAWVTKADYGAGGILFILVLYWFRYCPAERTLAGAAALMLCEGPVNGLAAWIAFFFINRYNGEKGKELGRLPYLFYPLHLLIIFAAGALIYGYNF